MRNNFSAIAIALFTVFSIVISGCTGKDYSLAPVSGTVTYEGEPVDKLRVSFSPMPVGDNLAVGPYSKGKTDSSGKFTLVTRYDEPGAVAGKHQLAFEYSDISESAMGELNMMLIDAKETGSKEEFKKAQEGIAKLKAKLKGRPVLGKCIKIIDIPADGNENLQLELSELFEK